ncbi:MAG: porin [Pikeienuella sp.]
MKKFLLTSSALVVAAGFASGASAAEWETGVGGYFYGGMALTDNDSAADGFGVVRDGEIYLTAKLVADNGITFGAIAQLEAWTQGGDQIDENYVYVDGSFGRIEFGGNDDATYTMVSSLAAFSAFGAHLGYQDNFGLTGAGVAGAGTGIIGGGRDAVGVHYYTPRFYGFQAGASYIPSNSADGLGDSNNFVFDSNVDESWAVAANYVGDFGDFGFDVGVGYYEQEGAFGSGFDSLGIAGGVSYAGFGFRGFYDDDSRGDEWGVGLQYQTGPWTVAGGYSDSNVVNSDNISGWVTYAAAPGVTVGGGIEWAETGADEDIGGAMMIGLSF